MFRTTSRLSPRVAATGIAAAALAVTLGACSSSTSGAPSSHGSIQAPSHHRPTSSAPAQSPSAQSPSAQTVALKSRLLGAADIGGGFRPATSDGSIDALPCTMGATRPYKMAQDVARAAFLDAKRTAQIDEEILRFADQGTAELAYDHEVAGYGCGATQLEDGRLTITGPTDIRPALTANGIAQADAWNLAYHSNKGIVTVVRIGTTLVKLHFLSDGKATPTVDAQQVIQAAVAKTISGS